MQGKIEQYITDVIEGKKKGVLSGLVKACSFPFSLGYQTGCFLRNKAYDRGWLKIEQVPLPVISIGNIVAGGVGKTPLVLKLAQDIALFGNPGIVTRGYRSEAEKAPIPLVLSKGKGPEYPALIAGDEAYLLAKNVPQAIVCVGKNKVEGAKIAYANGAQCILLDDGFQHRQLARDIEIVVISSSDPFGKGHFLPLGYLRDEVKSLIRADLIVIAESGKKLAPEEENAIRKLTSVPFVHAKQEISHFYDWDNAPLALDIKGMKIAIFCGIGSPQRFYQSLQGLGADIVEACYFPDHLAAHGEAMERFVSKSKEKGAQLLLCTEKDRVKLSDQLPHDLPFAWTRTALTIAKGNEHWDRLLQKIRELMSKEPFPL